MNETLISNYNSLVSAKDTVVWLGDCFFLKKKEALEIMNRLNGNKILIRGNHDKSPLQMLELGFEKVAHNLWMTIADKPVQLCHFPFKPHDFKNLNLSWLSQHFIPKYELRFKDQRPNNVGQFLIHGHTHSSKRFQKRSIHVGVDAWGFKPVHLDEIETYIRKVS